MITHTPVNSIGLGFLSVLHLFVLTKANLLVPFFDFAYFVVFVLFFGVGLISVITHEFRNQ